jgi:hypothetical protein
VNRRQRGWLVTIAGVLLMWAGITCGAAVDGLPVPLAMLFAAGIIVAAFAIAGALLAAAIWADKGDR